MILFCLCNNFFFCSLNVCIFFCQWLCVWTSSGTRTCLRTWYFFSKSPTAPSKVKWSTTYKWDFTDANGIAIYDEKIYQPCSRENYTTGYEITVFQQIMFRVLPKIWSRGRITLGRRRTMPIKGRGVNLSGSHGGGGGWTATFFGGSRSLPRKILKLGFQKVHFSVF